MPFYKPAQLTAADLSVAFEGKGPGRFDDLTPCPSLRTTSRRPYCVSTESCFTNKLWQLISIRNI